MMGFKSFRAARNVLVGIELMHMIRKGQMIVAEGEELSFADQFYALAGKLRPGDVQSGKETPQGILATLARQNPVT